MAQGERNINIDHVFKGNFPDKVVIAFVSAERYNGSYELNPFLLHHHDVNTLSLLVDDVSIPHCPMEMNFSKRQFASPHHNLLSTHPNIIMDSKSFGKGYTLFVFYLNTSQNEGELSLVKNGTISLEGQFDRELLESIQVIIYGEYQLCVTIDATRAVYHTKI